MPKRTAMDFIAAEAWAIRPEWLQTICEIAEREHEYAGDLQALETRLGRPLANTERATVRDGVAVVPVIGPLYRYANLMTELSGATSYQVTATDFQQALDDPNVSAIVLNIDSPGGMAKGANELSALIASARGVKPVVAYIGGDGASAAYWLAAAADEIVAEETATVGSIGAMLGLRMSEPRQGERAYSFVSSVSPLKNAGPDTEPGARELQRYVDELGQAFVDTVARYRGISASQVLEQYGQGAIFTGRIALQRGMVDRLGTLEGVISELASRRPMASSGPLRLTAAMVPAEAAALLRAEGAASIDTATVAAEARAAGAAAERSRWLAVEALSVPGCEALVAELAADPAVTVGAAALRIAQALASGSASETGQRDPVDQTDPDDFDNTVAAILAAGNRG